jgi:hypothetical protein
MSGSWRNDVGGHSAADAPGPSDRESDVTEPGKPGRAELSAAQIKTLESDRKFAILGTLDDGDLPHLTLVTSLQAKDATRLMFGQFCEGRAKSNLTRDVRAGFLVLDGSGSLISGTARWSSCATSGTDYEAYNRKPMFRYNAYSGIHRVHYLDLVHVAAPQRMDVTRATLGALAAGLARLGSRRHDGEQALTPWAVRHINGLRTLKFAGVVGSDGFPRIAAAVPCSALGHGRLALGSSSLGVDTTTFERGDSVAVLALNLQFESVMVRGRLSGVRRTVGGRMHIVEIEDVYNSMPFKQGPIYPMPPLKAVTDFETARV